MILAWLAQSDPVETSLSWPVIAGGVTAVLTAVGLVLGGLGWYVRAVVGPVREQTATSNGRTLGTLVEHITGKVDGMSAEMTKMNGWVYENRELIAAARALAEQAHARLDSHIISHDKESS